MNLLAIHNYIGSGLPGFRTFKKPLLSILIAFGLMVVSQTSFSQVTLNCSAAYQISHTFSNNAKWDMCWERNDREGIIYLDIHYTTPSGIARKVLNSAAIAQIHVPYDDNGARYHDVSDYGLGTSNYLNNLQAVDCPNGTRLAENGKNMVCKTITTGEVSAYNNSVATDTEFMSVFSVSHVGAYNYIPEYRFYDTGMIEPIMGATGTLQRYGSTPSEGWTVRTGSNPVGISHLHNYYWKLDFDLGNSGTDDIFEEIEFTADNANNTSFSKSVTSFSTEIARSMNPATKRFWRVRDNTLLNSDGFPVSYDILAMETGHRDTGPSSEPWTFDDVYVTRYRACERFISHNPSDPGGCSSNEDVTDFVDGESLTNEDLVVWFGLTFHHIPRDEDEPRMHAHWNHFRLIPRDWTATSTNNLDFAPVVNNPGEQHTITGTIANLQISANDANNDTLTYAATGLPAGLSIDSGTGLISGTVTAALATYNVTVTVSDATNNTPVIFDWFIGDDIDVDGISSTIDNCPNISNPSQIDLDNDGIGDACDVTAVDFWTDDLESGNNWLSNPAGTDTATTGLWNVGDPEQTTSSGSVIQRENAASGTNAMITDTRAGSSVGTYDIDSGITSIRSPAITLPLSGDIELSFNHYFAHLSNTSNSDYFRVSLVDTNNASVLVAYEVFGSSTIRSENWQSTTLSLNSLQGQTIMVLSEAADAGTGSIIEAGLDNIVIKHTESDTDIDGIGDTNDNCPNTANSNQADIDNDGLGDVCDNFPNDPDNDIDGDGISGDIDNCPSTANSNQTNTDGDGQGDVCDSFPNDPDNDIDGDGISGHIDNCPLISNVSQTNTDSDPLGDACDSFPNDPDNDIDGDSISGHIDNCPTIANTNQINTDGDALGDACDSFPNDPDNDIDGDGISGHIDNCPTIVNVNQVNTDGDTLGDACDSFPNDPDNDIDGDSVSGHIDNCPAVANINQVDTDSDTLGDACDSFPNDPDNDIDGDSVSGHIDNCPAVANTNQVDTDSDTLGDACDSFPNDPDNDIDGDGISGDIDNCPSIANTNQINTDGDANGNACDTDDDNDGLSDTEEATFGTNPLLADTDGDGIDDATEIANGSDPNAFDANIPIPLWLTLGLTFILAGIYHRRRSKK